MSKEALDQVIRFIIHQSELNNMAYLIVIYYLSKNDLHNYYKISDSSSSRSLADMVGN